MQEIKERFFVFIAKLEERMKEFAEASIVELESLNSNDPDEFKRGYHRMKAAVLGQLDSIRRKASEVKEEKIDAMDHGNDHRFRMDCYDRYQQFEKLYEHYRSAVEATSAEDFEIKYRKILAEYEEIKDQFRCTQCGSPIAIDKIYFTTTYITCPSCHTRNTFEPSSQAKMLEHIGRSLAEQRTAHLLREHDAIPQRTHDLYLQAHQLGLSLIHEKDKQVIAQKQREIEALHKEKAELESRLPGLYQVYLRAMFDEWNQISPDLAVEHEKFYNRLLNDYKQYKH
jgi:DNA-directed RNA polymerase subunit RPC12/RpoP